jgi:hypothetical protein
LFAGLLSWFYYSFFSARTNISQLLQEIPLDEKNLPPNVSDIFTKLDVLRIDKTENKRIFLRCKNIQGMKNMEMKAHEITWLFLVPIYLSESERLSVYAHLMPFAKGQGLSFGAKFYFSKNVNELTELEILKLLVISKSPAKYLSIKPNDELDNDVKKLKDSQTF